MTEDAFAGPHGEVGGTTVEGHVGLVGRLEAATEDPDVRQALLTRPDAEEALLFAMSDTRLSPQLRSLAGGLLAELGDPRLSGPERLGHFHDVPGGAMHMGAQVGFPDADTNSQPQHQVQVAPFAMARYPVTNEAYQLFVDDGGYGDDSLWTEEGVAWRTMAKIEAPHQWPRDASRRNHPVVGVSWFEAMAYASWVSRRMAARGELADGVTVHLPSEAQWEKAARGGLLLDEEAGLPNAIPDRHFPWGDGFVPGVANTVEAELGATSPVGMFPESDGPYRSQDLAGNVYEWCTSRMATYPYHATDGRETLRGNARTYRIVRGGAWPFNSAAAHSYSRHWYHADYRAAMVGFRVVRSESPLLY